MKITRENLIKFLTTFATIVGIIIGIASLSTLNQTILIIVITIILISAIAIAIFLFWKRENQAIRDLLKSNNLSVGQESYVRTLRNAAELKIISDLDKKTYGEHSVDLIGLMDWWMRYPDGIYALFYNHAPIGAVGIWPLTNNVFDMLVAGRLKESDIRKEDICEKSEQQIHWYFGDIILEKKYRGRKLSYLLLLGATDQWLNTGFLAEKVELCSMGATNKGEKLLRKLGFLFCTRSPDGLAVYRRTALVTELVRDFEELRKTGEGLPSTIPTK